MPKTKEFFSLKEFISFCLFKNSQKPKKLNFIFNKYKLDRTSQFMVLKK
jgi:hypothetical protein